MKLADVMTRDVRCAEPTTHLAEVALMMQQYNVGAIPVCEGDRLLGIITDRDIVTRCLGQGDDPRECEAQKHMSQDVVVGSPSMEVEEALELMRTGQIRRLPVVEGNKLVGIVSLGDLSVEMQREPQVAVTLAAISQPVHQTDEGVAKAAA